MRFHIKFVDNFDGNNLCFIAVLIAFVDGAGVTVANNIVKPIAVGAYSFFVGSGSLAMFIFWSFTAIKRRICVAVRFFLMCAAKFCVS